ncbi:MAG: DMT family transporter [Bryobacteraceae bacterium]|nr:DMT family transporter [Bryobacteraceae bacterium]
MSGRDHTWGAACAILSALGFAGKAVLIKVIYAEAHVDAITLLALRMLFSMPFFAWLGWRAARRHLLQPLTPRDWMALSAMGFLGYYLSSFLDFWALEFITAALERIILFTYPTWVLLLSAVFLGKRITGRDVFALSLSSAGIVVIFWNDLRLAGSPALMWKGGLLVLAASLVYSVYLITSGGVIARVGSARFTPCVSATAAVFVLSHFLLTRPAKLIMVPPKAAMLCLALAVFSTVLPILFLVEALKRVSAGTVAIASSVGPILTILMGYAFLGEPVTLAQLAGAALVLAGVGWISRPPTVQPS